MSRNTRFKISFSQIFPLFSHEPNRKSPIREKTNLSPPSPLAPKSLWESRTMILSSLDLWTRMLCTADESATTRAKPSPTNPNTHSISATLLSLSLSACSFFPLTLQVRDTQKRGQSLERQEKEPLGILITDGVIFVKSYCRWAQMKLVSVS